MPDQQPLCAPPLPQCPAQCASCSFDVDAKSAKCTSCADGYDWNADYSDCVKPSS